MVLQKIEPAAAVALSGVIAAFAGGAGSAPPGCALQGGLASGSAGGSLRGRAGGGVPDSAPDSDIGAGNSAAVAVDACRVLDDPAADVRQLEQIGEHERERVGNKAWNLARLKRAGLPVPPGFVIASDAIPAACASAEQLPVPLVAAIRSAYRKLGASHVAVRSSAADEDLAGQSAAGLYASFLNVRGEHALLDAVFACWQARQAPRARLGRQAASGMAVLVQAQVEAEAAGVLFTADPLAKPGEERLLINAVWGLAEPLAAGRVSGDVFHADKVGQLLQQSVSRKERMLTAAGEQPVPPGRRRRPALTAPQIRRLAQLARRIGAQFAAPENEALDIEFAICAGQPVLLQARPVPRPARALVPDDAALAAWLDGERRRLGAHCTVLRAEGRLSGDDVVFSAGNIRELLPTPSAFSFGLFRYIFGGRAGAIVAGRRRLGYRLGPDAGEDLFALIGGQPYFNLEIDAATYDAGVPLPVPELIAAVHADPSAASYPELGLYPRLLAASPEGEGAAAAWREHLLAKAAVFGRRYRRLLPLLERRRLLSALTHDAHDACERREALGETEALDAAGPNDAAALQAELAAGLARLRRLGRRFVIAARLGFFFAERVSCQLREGGLAPDRAARCYASLLHGLPGSRITEQGCALERLAYGEIDTAAYLADYGHMASNELELLLPRLAEAPGELDRQVAELLASGRRPRHEFARHAVRRRRTEALLRRRMAASGNGPVFFADLAAAQTFLPLRETFKYYLAAEYARLRPLLRALGTCLGLADDDLFHLAPEEVLALPLSASGAGARFCKKTDELPPLPLSPTAGSGRSRREAENSLGSPSLTTADAADCDREADAMRAPAVGRPASGALAEIAALCGERRRARALARQLARRRPLPAVIFASQLATLGASCTDETCPAPSDTTQASDSVEIARSPLANGRLAGPPLSVLPATPIAPGVAEGIVRLLWLDEDELGASLSAQLPAMHGEEIIVAPSANLGLAPLFRAAAGVVVETGGVLAHSACQAREAGIPALVLADAMRRLHDGDRIRIDAGRGEITILARAATPREGLR